MQRLLCLVRGRHEASRHPLGGFRCLDCGAAGVDLAEMGTLEHGYVSPVRMVFTRERHEITRTSAWEAGRRGW